MFKKGDRVKVIRKVRSGEVNPEFCWQSHMTGSIGKTFTVKDTVSLDTGKEK